MPPPPSTTKKVTARTSGAVAGNASRKQPSATDTTDRHSLRSILVASVYRLVLLGAVGAVVLAAWMPDHPLVAPYVAFFTSNATRAQTPMSTGATSGLQLVPLADALASTQRFPCGGLRLVQQDGVLMVDMHQLQGAAIANVGAQTIPLSFVNDDFCDCADGSDEPLTSACATSAAATFASPSPTPGQQQRFYCRGDSSTAVPLWKVMDGVDDCCDGSDEDRDGVRLRTTPIGDAAAKCAAVVAKRARAAAAEARRLASGHRQFQQRAVYGSTKFGPAFVANVTKESAALDAAFADFQQKVGVLNERIRRSQQSRGQGHFQQQAQEDGGNVDGDVAEEEAPTVDPAEIAQAQQWNQYFTQRRGELGTKQAVLHHKALGQYFEYFPLFGKCFNFTIHEKQLKGGTAIPEQYNVTFRVCPFMYVLQRTETPEVVAAAARIATGSQQQQQQQQQGVTSTEDGATGDAATRRQDGETSRFIVAGYWTGQLANQFDNITSINILEPLRRGDAPEAAAGDVWVSQFTHGEACWNGPARSAALVFQCDTDDRVRTVVENGMCRYEILFGTPSACNDAVMAAAGGSGGGRDARPV